jgi:hypothetical protein
VEHENYEQVLVQDLAPPSGPDAVKKDFALVRRRLIDPTQDDADSPR